MNLLKIAARVASEPLSDRPDYGDSDSSVPRGTVSAPKKKEISGFTGEVSGQGGEGFIWIDGVLTEITIQGDSRAFTFFVKGVPVSGELESRLNTYFDELDTPEDDGNEGETVYKYEGGKLKHSDPNAMVGVYMFISFPKGMSPENALAAARKILPCKTGEWQQEDAGDDYIAGNLECPESFYDENEDGFSEEDSNGVKVEWETP